MPGKAASGSGGGSGGVGGLSASAPLTEAGSYVSGGGGGGGSSGGGGGVGGYFTLPLTKLQGGDL